MEEIAARIKTVLQTKEFSGSLKFDCGDAGLIVLAEGTASTTDRETDCTLHLTEENLVKLLKGQLNPVLAMATGKLKLSGNPVIAMNLAKLLG